MLRMAHATTVDSLFELYAQRQKQPDPPDAATAAAAVVPVQASTRGVKRKTPSTDVQATVAAVSIPEPVADSKAKESADVPVATRVEDAEDERPVKRRRFEAPPFVARDEEGAVDSVRRVLGDATAGSLDRMLARFGARIYSLHGSYFTVHLTGDAPIEVAALEGCLSNRSFPLPLTVTGVDFRGQDKCVRIELTLSTYETEFHSAIRAPAAYVERKTAAAVARSGQALYPHASRKAMAAIAAEIDSVTTRHRVERTTEGGIARLKDDEFNANMLLPIAEFVVFSRKDATPVDILFAAEYDAKCMQFCLQFLNAGNFKLHELRALRDSLPRHIASVDFCPVKAQLTVTCCEYVHPMPTEYNRVVATAAAAATDC